MVKFIFIKKWKMRREKVSRLFKAADIIRLERNWLFQNKIEINYIIILIFITNLCFISHMNHSSKHTASGSSITKCVYSHILGFNSTMPVCRYINCKSRLIRKEAFAYSSLISPTRFIINVQAAQRAKTGNRKSQASAPGSRRKNKSAV